VSRVIRFGPDYQVSLARGGVRGRSETSRAIGVTVRALEEAEGLPGPDDAQGLAPQMSPVARWAFARRVPGLGLWVWYVADDGILTLLAVSRD